jgi:ribosomal protein S27E
MDTELRLDGNAVAGMLDEMLSVEATTVVVRCVSCGAEGALGAVHAYVHGPGVVLRCPGCSEVLMRFAHIRGHLVADMHGVGRMTI